MNRRDYTRMRFSTLPTEPVKKYFVLIALLLFFVICTLFIAIIFYLNTPVDSDSEDSIRFEIEQGSSLSAVSAKLNSLGVLSYPQLFSLLARFRGEADQLRAGEFELALELSPAQILDKLVAGQVTQYRVTFIEGWTLRQALEEVWQSERVLIELRGKAVDEISAILDLEQLNPEGMFFPDTYFYTGGSSDVQILRQANARMDEVLADAWETRLGALPFTSPYEALTLASIVERESAVGAERAQIAGVFVRRLELGMRLQSDPTVIYGMGDRYTGNISRSDLRELSAYNTYRIDGLPPTPIGMAGMESIRAALNPLETDFIYFVAKGDGTHHFSSSLEEHNEAVNRYQIEGNL